MELYSIGTTEFTVTDNSRTEKLGPALGNRRIPIRLFYPVTKENVTNMELGVTLSDRKAEAIIKAFKLPKIAKAFFAMDCYENAPWSEGEKYPLLLFSPGYNSYVESNSQLCVSLAASGYIVAAVGHANELIENDYEDGTCDFFDKKIGKLMYAKGTFSALRAQFKVMKKSNSLEEADKLFDAFQKEQAPFLMERVKEWAADMLYALNVVRDRFDEHIDFTNGVAAAGHSLGGATAYYLCQTSEEISCGLNIDGALFGMDINRIMEKPFYQFACKENWNLMSSVLLRRKAPVYTAVFSNMKHVGFTDIKLCSDMKMVVGTLDYVTMNHYLLGGFQSFLGKYLSGDDIDVISYQETLNSYENIHDKELVELKAYTD